MERKPDITQWAKKANELGITIGNSADEILEQSQNKKERIEKSGLPTGTIYGPYDSFEEIEKVVSLEKRKDTRYFVRCVPKNYKKNSNLEIKRINNVNYDQAKELYGKILEDKENYTVTLLEIWEPEYSGGVVINQGRVMIDLEKGDKFYSKEDSPEEIKGASLDVSGQETRETNIHFDYSNDPTKKEKEIMMEAIKYFNPELNRDIFEQLKIYTDFYYSSKYGFKFVDYFEGEKADKYTLFKKKM